MKTYLMELGSELIKSAPCSGALLLQVADVLTLGLLANVIMITYGACQLAFLFWRWRKAKEDRANG